MPLDQVTTLYILCYTWSTVKRYYTSTPAHTHTHIYICELSVYSIDAWTKYINQKIIIQDANMTDKQV